MTNPDAVKRCPCPEAAWNKCGHDWYMAKLRHAGKEYAPNVTRYALDVLGKTITTKTEAVTLIANTIAPAIRTGAYVSAKDARRAAVTDRATTAAGATIADVITAFTADVIHADLSRSPDTRGRETTYIARFGAFVPPGRRVALGRLPIAAPSDDDLVRDVKAWRHSLHTFRNNTWAKYRTLIGQFFRYAVARRYRASDPLAGAADHDRKALRRGKGESRRQRIDDADERRLLTAAGRLADPDRAAWLVALIVAALDTGMRLGELLALQWGDVDLAGGRIYVRAEEAGAKKTNTARILPIFARLGAVLRDRKGDADDPRFARTAYVFGNAIGGRLRHVWRLWAIAVLGAHGHAAEWTTKPKHQLTGRSAAALKAIGWHFHDLRHEAGCRWLESKIFDLEQIRQLYGHATIAQTAKYLHAASGSAFKAAPDYDAYRARLASEAKTAAAAALDTGRGGDKLGTNARRRPRSAGGPRLVKGGNS